MTDAIPPTMTVVQPAPASPSALRSGRAHLRLWFLALICLFADLWSKAWAFDSIKVGEVRPFIRGILEFRLSLNPGALFGLGSGLVPVFIIASIAALAFVIYLFAGTRREQWVMHAALALIFAGAMGNLYDRTIMQRDLLRFKAVDGRQPFSLLGDIEGDRSANVIKFRPWGDARHAQQVSRDELTDDPRRVGVVRDFLKIRLQVGKRELWPWVFNLADVFLVVGVGVLLLSYTARSPAPASATTPVAEQAV
jgi:lipoprotein signal peptidase